MVLKKFQDKPLSGLLAGIVMIKLLRGECKISRSVRRSINAVKIDFLILRNFGKNFVDGGFMWKDQDEKNEHFHFFPKNDNIGIGLVVTDETKKYPNPDRHIPVDNKKFFEVFGKEIDSYFKKNQEIVDSQTTRFDKCRIITYNPEVTDTKKKKKMLYLEIDENEKEITIDEFRNTESVLGIVLDEFGIVNEFVVKKGNKIYCFDYKVLREICLKLFPILRENYKHSES